MTTKENIFPKWFILLKKFYIINILWNIKAITPKHKIVNIEINYLKNYQVLSHVLMACGW
jgi:hypothetical protein